MPRRLLIISAAVVGVIVVAGFGAWWFLLRSNAPAAVSLEDAVNAVTSTSAPGADPATTVAGPTGLDGVWIVSPDSFAGYRVQEELASVGFTTAAGRSESIEGSLAIEGGTVTTVEVVVDMTALRSDSARRDRSIETQALETRDFPTATFVLAAPIALPAAAEAGEAFTIPATGELTIHGVTNRVTIDLEAQLVGDKIVAVGSTPIRFAAYGIEEPSAIVVLSVANNGVMEFQLVFSRV